MHRCFRTLLFAQIAVGIALCQTTNFPYIHRNFAGSFPLGEAGPASSALLYYPYGTAVDSSGNVYILDSNNYLIRKVAPDGTISTVTALRFFGYEFKLGTDGNFYVGAFAQVYKVTPAGTATVIAGTGTFGYSGDGQLAVNAQIGTIQGICLDSLGNIYIADGNRLREITSDGKIQTIAGSGTGNFTGDNGQASASTLNQAYGMAVDRLGNFYFADSLNRRIRKISAQGIISTVAGNGGFGQPKNGAAVNSPIGTPFSVAVDSALNVYFTDTYFHLVAKIVPGGGLVIIGGDANGYDAPTDGPATSSSLLSPRGLSVDGLGNVFVADQTHRIRQITPDGNLKTLAGKLHYGGDGGPAASALLNFPSDVAVDARGNVFIADASNYRIRKVATDGTISTYAGTGIPNYPADGAQASGSALNYTPAMTFDSQGNLITISGSKILKITPDGVITTTAGTGTFGNTGDGGPATQATLGFPSGIAIDSSGNIYVSDNFYYRVRKISAADGTISAFAGAGSQGYTGDGGLATSAQLRNYSGAIACDSAANVYIGDSGNNVVRMVSPAGIITTVAGNGTFGSPGDGAQAKSAVLSGIVSIAVDAADNVFLASQNYGYVYRLSGGVIRRINGFTAGNTPTDGTPAGSLYFFVRSLKVDSNGDIYAVDSGSNMIRKLVLNSPNALSIVDGNNQAGPVGKALPKALKVLIGGRAGLPVAGATVSFTVKSGSATVSSNTTQTDSSGLAAVGVTFGPNAGSVVITASAVGTSVAPVQFTLTAGSSVAGCTASAPAIVSINSAGDYGGFGSFASGSWLEIKGTNLSPTTRQWGGDDFKGSNAPTSLDNVAVSINGNAGFVLYISPGQINAQAPSDSTIGNVQIAVSNCAGTSVPVNLQKQAIVPGMLSPSVFKVGGKQYLAGVLPDGNYVGNANLISGVAFRPAKPGETIIAYGIGFGAVTPSIAPGIIVGQSNRIPNLTIAFGTTQAAIAYAGLAPNYVGLYQFNFTVPSVADGDYVIDIQTGGQKLAQTLYLTVHR